MQISSEIRQFIIAPNIKNFLHEFHKYFNLITFANEIRKLSDRVIEIGLLNETHAHKIMFTFQHSINQLIQ